MHVIRLLDGLLNRDFVIPGSTAPVRMARLHVDPDGRSVSLVRFPPGWTRPARGHYLAGEELVVLEGELHVSGIVCRPGDFGWIPARALRFDSGTSSGVLALACFDGPPTWVAGDGGDPEDVSLRVPLRTAAVPESGLPLGNGTLLLSGTHGPLGRPAEVVTVDGWRWGLLDADEPLPEGRLLVRPTSARKPMRDELQRGT